MAAAGGFTDYFAAAADAYARARPRYPAALYAAIDAELSGHALAWDCASGSGQAVAPLAARFACVVATDASAAQLARLRPAHNVRRVLARAEQAPLADGCADLVTVAQALHWFALPAFYAEVRRVLRPGGVLAAWTYDLPTVGADVDALLAELYGDTLAGCWPPERQLVERRYAGLPWPFADTRTLTLEMRAQWRRETLLGYLASWSAVGVYRQRHGVDPLARWAGALRTAWGERARRAVRWPLTLRLARLS
ncbi:MAG: class I SAM-dependent methyltransferase [Gammaproteobacteria bacterium]